MVRIPHENEFGSLPSLLICSISAWIPLCSQAQVGTHSKPCILSFEGQTCNASPFSWAHFSFPLAFSPVNVIIVFHLVKATEGMRRGQTIHLEDSKCHPCSLPLYKLSGADSRVRQGGQHAQLFLLPPLFPCSSNSIKGELASWGSPHAKASQATRHICISISFHREGCTLLCFLSVSIPLCYRYSGLPLGAECSCCIWRSASRDTAMDLQTVTATAVMHLTGFQEQRLVHPFPSDSALQSPLGNDGYSYIAFSSGCEDL